LQGEYKREKNLRDSPSEGGLHRNRGKQPAANHGRETRGGYEISKVLERIWKKMEMNRMAQ